MPTTKDRQCCRAVITIYASINSTEVQKIRDNDDVEPIINGEMKLADWFFTNASDMYKWIDQVEKNLKETGELSLGLEQYEKYTYSSNSYPFPDSRIALHLDAQALGYYTCGVIKTEIRIHEDHYYITPKEKYACHSKPYNKY